MWLESGLEAESEAAGQEPFVWPEMADGSITVGWGVNCNANDFAFW